MKRALAITLALLTFLLPVRADAEEDLSDPGEFVSEIMDSWHFSEGSYAVAFKSMCDGETWYYNADEYFKVASVYKLPLNMYFYEMEAAGEIDPDTRIAGMTLDQCHYYSLEFSNNEISEAMLDYLGGYSQYKRDILKYIGDAAEDVTNDYYYDNAFTAEMVLNILDYLYEHSDVFEEQIGHMLLAQPDEYLESGELDCDIAQKYGYETYDGALHVAVAGIVYAGEPFLITVLTRYNYGAVYAMGELCDAFAAWDAERISALRQDSNGAPAQITDPEEQAEENELEYLRSAARSAILDAAQAACAVSPLPSLLPWDEIFSALNI